MAVISLYLLFTFSLGVALIKKFRPSSRKCDSPSQQLDRGRDTTGPHAILYLVRLFFNQNSAREIASWSVPIMLILHLTSITHHLYVTNLIINKVLHILTNHTSPYDLLLLHRTELNIEPKWLNFGKWKSKIDIKGELENKTTCSQFCK